MCGVMLSCALLECLLRVLSSTSADGAVFVLRTPCLPLRPPLSKVEEKLGEYGGSSSTAIQYDSSLGWSPASNSRSADGMYRFDENGARRGMSAVTVHSGAEAVSLFGDSTMFGVGVPYEASIGALLQNRWGSERRVSNFAVGAYGMDQAFLRWRVANKAIPARRVLFGFQAENIKRNATLFRAFYLYDDVDIPFSKPRFALESDGTLRLINSPTVPTSGIMRCLRAFQSCPLSQYEYYYRPRWFSDSLLYRSRLAAFSLGAIFLNNKYVVRQKERDTYDPQGELGQLALSIMRAFKAEVEATGADFVVVHLPRKVAVSATLQGEKLVYDDLLTLVQREFHVIDALPPMVDEARRTGADRLFVDPWHYSSEGASVVAEAIAREVP